MDTINTIYTTTKELNENGFIQFEPKKQYFINISGLVYNLKSKKFLKPYKAKNGYLHFSIKNQTYNIAKLIIDNFGNAETKTDYIRFKDGCKDNLTLSNIEYCTLSNLQKNRPKTHKNGTKQPRQKENHAETAFLYSHYTDFDEKSMKTLLSMTEYKKEIENRILQARTETKEQYLKMIVFIDYTNGKEIDSICKMYELSKVQTHRFIKEARAKLKTDIQKDIENGILTKPEPQTDTRPTQTEILKEYEKKLGIKISKRNKSENQILKNYRKRLNRQKLKYHSLIETVI